MTSTSQCTDCSSKGASSVASAAEATREAAQQYRDQNKVSVTTTESTERTVTETREIENPNNELTVTYLFYELQRRFEVRERLHDVTPVILVAYQVPQPHKITEAWLLRHDWIIREAILDDSYLPALAYLSQTFAGDEVSVEILQTQWETQLSVVAQPRRQGAAHQQVRDAARDAIEWSVRAVGASEAGQDLTKGGIGFNLAKRLFEAGEEVASAELDNARSALDWAEQDLARTEGAMREAVTALEQATRDYVAAMEQRINRRLQIDRLILHVKENILHYMQAIWRREHPDQRYLRLYDMEIQWPGPVSGRFHPGPVNVTAPIFPNLFNRLGRRPGAGLAGTLMVIPPTFREKRKLHQVANLQKPLGFRGNLAIFPLVEHNALSSFMAQEFLDSHYGLMDPDPLASMPTASEALDIAKCAWQHPEVGEDDKREIAEWLMDRLRAAHQASEEIVVPTGELFIEALPGTHPLLEDYKLQHRAYDAQRARAEAKASELDLLRRALRLESGDLEDPVVDKRIEVTGSAAANVTIDGDE